MSLEPLLQLTYNLSLIGALWATALGLGLRSEPGQLRKSFMQGQLLLRGLVVNLLLIPISVWVLTSALRVEPGIAIGLVLLAASAGGPYGLAATQLAVGDSVFALALISILQVTRVVAIPVWLGLYLPFSVADIVEIILVIFLYILLPGAIGLFLQRFLKQNSLRWANIARRLANVFLVILIISAIALYRQVLAALIVSPTIVLILGIQILSVAFGYILGGPTLTGRKTLAVTAAVRSSATTALLLATQVYGAQPQVAATVVAYGVTALVVSSLAALGLAQLKEPGATQQANLNV